MHRTSILIAVAIGSLVAAAPGFAQTLPIITLPAATFNGTVYSDRASFNAAAGSTFTNGFEFTPSNPGYPVQQYPTGFFSDSNGTTYSLTTRPAQPNNGVVDLNLLDSTYGGSGTTGGYIGSHYGSDVLTSNYQSVVFTFAQPTTAFGLDFGSYGRAFAAESDTFTFTANNGIGTYSKSSTSGAPAFFGFTSSTAFTSITIDTSSSANRVYDNVTVTAAAAAVPEASTWSMMIAGIGMLGVALRRSRRSKSRRAIAC